MNNGNTEQQVFYTKLLGFLDSYCVLPITSYYDNIQF